MNKLIVLFIQISNPFGLLNGLELNAMFSNNNNQSKPKHILFQDLCFHYFSCVYHSTESFVIISRAIKISVPILDACYTYVFWMLDVKVDAVIYKHNTGWLGSWLLIFCINKFRLFISAYNLSPCGQRRKVVCLFSIFLIYHLSFLTRTTYSRFV